MSNNRDWDTVLDRLYPRKGEGDDATTRVAATTVLNDVEVTVAERVRAEVTKNSLDIIAACGVAGQPARAAAFIASGTSVSDVVAALGTRHSARTRER